MGVDHQASVGLVAIPVGLGVPCWGSDLVSIRPVLVSCPPLDLDTVPGLEPCLLNLLLHQTRLIGGCARVCCPFGIQFSFVFDT